MSKKRKLASKQPGGGKSPATESSQPAEPRRTSSPTGTRFRKHMRIGWWSLLFFLSLGLILEGMHGFKVQWYVGAENTTRRLMFTLAHAHGTLLSLVHLAFAFAARELGPGKTATSSWCLTVAGFLLPLGFFAGGVQTYHGDPGLGILMVPIGGLLLVIGVLLTALSVESMGAGRTDRD